MFFKQIRSRWLGAMRELLKQHVAIMIAVSVSLVLSNGAPGFAQSVADAARQERERRGELARRTTHVYTNEDLAKPHILAPEDEARLAGQKGPASSETATVYPAGSASPANGVKDASAVPASTSAESYPTNAVRPANDARPMPIEVSEASNRVQPPAPLPAPEIRIPATTMPIFDFMGYGPSDIVFPATANRPLVRGVAERTRPTPQLPPVEIKVPASAVPFPSPAVYGQPVVEVPMEGPAVPSAPGTKRTEIAAPVVVSPADGNARDGRVKIAPGDSLWKLAVRYFGSGFRWKKLAALNPQLADPNRIRAGEWVRIPSDYR